uniref:Uncharacterized protein n=1 Tax=Acrobeloides nanus TaxID=290746 RepID=A0A914DUX7_9BILA
MEAMINFLNAHSNETIKVLLADDELVEHMYYIDVIKAIPPLCASLWAGVRTSDVRAHAHCGICELTRTSLNAAG